MVESGWPKEEMNINSEFCIAQQNAALLRTEMGNTLEVKPTWGSDLCVLSETMLTMNCKEGVKSF